MRDIYIYVILPSWIPESLLKYFLYQHLFVPYKAYCTFYLLADKNFRFFQGFLVAKIGHFCVLIILIHLGYCVLGLLCTQVSIYLVLVIQQVAAIEKDPEDTSIWLPTYSLEGMRRARELCSAFSTFFPAASQASGCCCCFLSL